MEGFWFGWCLRLYCGVHCESEIFIATWTKCLWCSAVWIFYSSNCCHCRVSSCLFAWRSKRVRWVWARCLQVIKVENKQQGCVFGFVFPLTSVLTKLKLMAWFNSPLAMTTCSLFSPSEALFAKGWTGRRLSHLVLVLSCCHGCCMSESLFNSPLFLPDFSLIFTRKEVRFHWPCYSPCNSFQKQEK